MSFSMIKSFIDFQKLDSSHHEPLSEYDFCELFPPNSPKKEYSLLIHGSYENYNGLIGDWMDIAGKKVYLHPNYKRVNAEPLLRDMQRIVQECFSPDPLRLKTPTPPPSRCASPDQVVNESYLSQLTSAIVTTYSHYFYDYDHAWKKVKYQLNLDMMKAQHSKIVGLWDTPPKTPLAGAMINLAFLLDYNSVGNKNQHPRKIYRDFLKKVRSILGSKDYLEQKTFMYEGKAYDKTIHDISELCTYRFTSVYLYPFFEKLITKIVSEGLQELNISEIELENIPLSKRLDLQFQAIKACPQLYKAPKTHIDAGKLEGTANILFDPHMGSNMPYVLYDLLIQWEPNSPIKPIRCLRIGTPTLQRTEYTNYTWAGEATINPEFEAFVEHLHNTGKTLLYISLQEDEERFICGEKARNDALRKLHEKYPNTFKLIVLAQDSYFYHQTGEHENIDDANLFKEHFLRELCERDEKTGFDVPEEFQDTEAFKAILNQVHLDFFGNRQELTKQERCDFIEIAYTRFNLLFLKKVQPDYFIICCKDGMERAKKLVILLLYTLFSMWDRQCEAEFRRMLETFTHAAAFFIKKQAMVTHRRERMLSALEVMEAHPETFLVTKNEYMVDGDVRWLDLV